MKAYFRIFTITCLLFGLLAIQPQSSTLQASTATKNEMPAGLQAAMLDASTQPFVFENGTYTASSQGLTFNLTANGVQAGNAGLNWGINLHGFGRENQTTEVSAPEIKQTKARLEYRHGALTEWYRDTALGVEQGFTIDQAPQGSGMLALQLDLSTDLEGIPDKDGRGLSFPTADGQTLRYDQLKAYDANETELDTSFIYSRGKVIIQVDDHDAVYPITIDPLVYLEQKVTASDGSAYDWLEAPVAISGDTAVVGAQCDDIGGNSNQGSAYVFVRNGETWTQQAKLTALDGDAEDLFGASVAIYGDTVLVGAYWDNVGGRSDQGSAYIFVRNGTTWTQQAQLTASDGVTSDPSFGYSVALSGDTALVGAVGNIVHYKGAAYIFVRNGTTWTEQAKLTASDGVIGDSFGGSVALSGDTAIIGATGVDVGANSSQGSAYVFVRTGTAWSQTAHLTASDGAPNDYLGNSVAISGDTVVVGAMADDSSTSEDVGSAYVFVRNGTNWIEEIKLGHALWGSEANDHFGSSVAISGDTVLVGAKWDNVGGISDQGSAYIFVRSSGTWLPQYKLTASDGAASDYFGFSVSISGDTAMVGAYGDDSAYFYTANRTDSDLAISAANATGNPVQTNVTLNLSVTNNGPANATTVMVDAGLPAGMSYISHTTSAGTYTYRNGSWSLGNLASGATATLSIVAAVGAIPGQTRTFTATILSTDTNNGNNTASALVQVSVGAFNKINPANGAVDQLTNITLNWQASTGATAYDYCIGEGVANLCKTSPIPWVSLGAANSVRISSLKQGTIYSWHVRARNSYSTRYSNGDYWSFTTGTQPETFSKSNPANGSTNRPVELSLSWGPSWGASEYQYCYDISNDDTCNDGGTWTSVNATLNSVTISSLISGQTYYWQVRAVNPIGETYANLDWWSFTTGSLPGAFGKISPANSASNQLTNLTLSWSASNGATSYQYCYDKFNDNTCNGSWITVLSIIGGGTSATISGLDGSTTYYWQVRALNSIGPTYADSSIHNSWWSFTTVDSTPPTILSITRADANPTTAASVNFTVTFSESVTGVSAADFNLTTSGVSGTTVSGVSGSGSVRTVSANTGSGSGTIRLDVPVSATITDLVGSPLSGLPFVTGETYTVRSVNVYIGGELKGSYILAAGQSTRVNYAGVDSGPVKVVNTNSSVPIIAAIRDAWAVNGVTTSFSQLMGLPLEQLSDKYVFPGYNNVTLNEQLRIANVDTTQSIVTVHIGGVLRGTYTLYPPGSLAGPSAVRVNYAALDSGPVVVQGTSGVKIISAMRDAWSVNGVITSFVQFMGLPATQLSNKYVFPAYNNVTLNEQLRIANVDTVPSTVKVMIGGVQRGEYMLYPPGSPSGPSAVRVNYAGLDNGPVVVEGTLNVKIISSIRDAWSVNGVTTSFSQLMGMPAGQLSNKYLFPAYNNVTVNDQLRIANVDTAQSTVTVTIGGVLRGTYTLYPPGSLSGPSALRINYAGLDSGPVVVQGTTGVKIISAIREAWSVNGAIQSFVQLMGLPSGQLSSTYLFPAYNNVTLNEQLRFGVP